MNDLFVLHNIAFVC